MAYKRDTAAGENKEKTITYTEKTKGKGKIAWQDGWAPVVGRERIACWFPVQEGQIAKAKA